MKVLASMDASLPLEQVPAYVARVERLGYDGIHVIAPPEDEAEDNAMARVLEQLRIRA